MSMNHHATWNNINDENAADAIMEYSNNNNNNTINNVTLPAVLSSNHNCIQS